MSVMKFKSVGYWVSTALIAAAFVLGGAIDTAAQPSALAFLAHLGYPAYFATLIGVWKVLGGLAVLAPRFPRLKEWAYAGIFFDLTGAAVSHASSGDGAAKIMVPLVLVGIGFASWSLRPQSRKLGGSAPEAAASTRFNATAKAAA
jgi:uncharacterized membrane protein YphA (DoxX/SURF4 family)